MEFEVTTTVRVLRGGGAAEVRWTEKQTTSTGDNPLYAAAYAAAAMTDVAERIRSVLEHRLGSLPEGMPVGYYPASGQRFALPAKPSDA